MRNTLRNAVFLAVVIACGCKDEDEDPDTQMDASGALPHDGGPDAGGALDGGGSAWDASSPTDAGAGLDAGAEAGMDAASDAAASDAGGAGQDAGGDAAAEAGQDAGGDSAAEAAVDAALDAADDASESDAGPDASASASDAASDASAGDAAADAAGDASDATTFTRVLSILRSNCQPCHTTNMSGGLRFSADSTEAYGQLVNEDAMGSACGSGDFTRVVPSDPDESLLIRKLEPSPPCGDRMPRGRDPLSSELIDEIRSWIAAGALDD